MSSGLSPVRVALIAATALAAILAPATFAAGGSNRSSSADFFAAAALRSHVPLPLLIAVSWEQSFLTNRENLHGREGYGFMGLEDRAGNRSLRAAAALMDASPDQVRGREDLNILGGALLLREYAKVGKPEHAAPNWTVATIRFMGIKSSLAAVMAVADINRILKTGITRSGVMLSPNQRFKLAPIRSERGVRTISRPGGADYAKALWAPAARADYSKDDRPIKHKIRFIVIHDTESSCSAAVNTFQDPQSRASAHYVVCRNGGVYQLVHERDVAWHAGNWPINQQSIGIEHEGVTGKRLYTAAEYLASARLVSYLTQKYGIDPNRNVVFGHENVPLSDHVDPGATWNWPFYMKLIRGDGRMIDSGTPEIAAIRGNAFIRSCRSQRCRLLGTANWGEQFFVRSRRAMWKAIFYGGKIGWVRAGITSPGAGYEVQVIGPTRVVGTNRRHGASIGVASKGQVYISLALVDGFWWIYFQHRYGFIPQAAGRVINCSPSLGVQTSDAACLSELGLWSRRVYLQSLGGLTPIG
jgi:hypothetical protein